MITFFEDIATLSGSNVVAAETCREENGSSLKQEELFKAFLVRKYILPDGLTACSLRTILCLYSMFDKLLYVRILIYFL